ncbi:hypothetical protein ALMP_70230 [Streptomyces sp. A012304]|nr:hypothetical protein ALMP_70230 [Streptomyces sp. A012304]
MASRSRLVRLTQQGAPNTECVETTSDGRGREGGCSFMALAFLICRRPSAGLAASVRPEPPTAPAEPPGGTMEECPEYRVGPATKRP